MNSSSLKRSARDSVLLHLMQSHGDAIVRTCLLLCGSPSQAHRYAQAVFLSAAGNQAFLSAFSRHRQRIHLLAAVMQLCPCNPATAQQSDSLLSQVLALAPDERRIAVLCLYHNLSPAQAARLCKITKGDALKLYIRIKKKLSGYIRTAR